MNAKTTKLAAKGYTYGTRKSLALPQGELVDIEMPNGFAIRGRIYTSGTRLVIAPEWSDWTPEEATTYAEFTEAYMAGRVVSLGGVATKFYAKVVIEARPAVEAEEAGYIACPGCSEPVDEEGEECEACYLSTEAANLAAAVFAPEVAEEPAKAPKAPRGSQKAQALAVAEELGWTVGASGKAGDLLITAHYGDRVLVQTSIEGKPASDAWKAMRRQLEATQEVAA